MSAHWCCLAKGQGYFFFTGFEEDEESPGGGVPVACAAADVPALVGCAVVVALEVEGVMGEAEIVVGERPDVEDSGVWKSN